MIEVHWILRAWFSKGNSLLAVGVKDLVSSCNSPYALSISGSEGQKNGQMERIIVY